ncbi:MAG TPA: hypothetical protein VHX86_07510 [Tepidisphaeraceae bacterium]|jgi:hypothetical protein|nr:hypothetical protein [Tepidisphaeraceae bacterium]
MIFASPLWFIALAPWAGLVVWLLSGRREKAGVPFLNLWQADAPQHPKPKRAWEKLPIALAALLAAMLLGIIAAAGPVISGGKSSAITVIVDRGIYSPFAKSAADLNAILRQSIPDAKVALRIVPPAKSTTGGDWLGRVSSLEPTAAEDSGALLLACRQALRETSGPVLLLSNRSIELNDPRLIQIASSDAITNVGIDLFSVRSGPATQAMVRVFNQSGLASARLTVWADGNIVQSRQVSLPKAGNKRDYFVDLPAAPNIVEAEVDCDDSVKINHRAWVIRRAAWPIVEARSSLPPALTRMIEVYSRHRPATESSQHIVVERASDPIPSDMPAAILPDAAAEEKKVSGVQPLIVRDGSPKIQSVDWADVLAGATASAPPPGNWRPMVSAGSSVIVATTDAPVKRVWIGFRADQFARRADFVVFWSAIFDWLGGGAPDYVSQPVGLLTGNWHLQQPVGLSLPADDIALVPGLYASGDGALDAVNASAPPIPIPRMSDWRSRLRSLRAAAGANASLTGAMLLIATALIVFSAATWPASKSGRRKTFQS